MMQREEECFSKANLLIEGERRLRRARAHFFLLSLINNQSIIWHFAFEHDLVLIYVD